MTVVGRVAALWRYPVKSMAAESLADVEVSWNGLAGDRRWAFIRDGQVSSGFPWLTIREQPEMAHYRPHFAEPDRPNASPTLVRTPSGARTRRGRPCARGRTGAWSTRHQAEPRSLRHDAAVLAVDTDAGLPRPDGRHGPGRGAIRPNLVVDVPGPAFPEDSWVGRVLRVGGMRMRVDQRDNRCVMVTIDPVTLRKDPVVLRTIAQHRDNQFGVYGSTVQPGQVAVGDPVELES